MNFLMLWITLGLSLLMLFGLDDVVAYISLDWDEMDEGRPVHPAYCALCLTLMVLAWPMLLMEYVQKRS